MTSRRLGPETIPSERRTRLVVRFDVVKPDEIRAFQVDAVSGPASLDFDRTSDVLQCDPFAGFGTAK